MKQLNLRWLGFSGIALLGFFIMGCCQCESPNEKPTSAKEKVSAGDDDCCPDCGSDVVDRKTILALNRSGANPLTAWPMFGGTLSRNLVNSADKNMPTEWVVEEGKQKNIKWVAQLGNKSNGGPVIAGGKVYVGTNNAFPRDPKIKGLKAVLMCFAEADGKFLWQAVHDYPANELFFKGGEHEGLCSSPAVEGKRLYYVTPGCELICAEADTGKGIWRLDMMKELKVVPHHLGNCSPLLAGDLVFALTSNGVDEDGSVVSPKAPSFVAVDKNTGKIAWQSNLPGDRIIEGQWSNPAYGVVNGKPQVVFPGGDNWLYSFEPATGKLIWKCNLNPGMVMPKDKERRITPPYAIATPVIDDNKVYLGLGLYPEHALTCKFSYFYCIDMTKTGDVSPLSLDAKAPQNKNSALVWAFGGKVDPKLKKERSYYFGRTMSTASVHNGLVYIAEDAGILHCLDAKTGKEYWDHDLLTGVWGSTLWVDNKVYLGTEDHEVVIFAHGKEKNLLAGSTKEGSHVSMGKIVHSTPVAVNGTLYVATPQKLYAISKK